MDKHNSCVLRFEDYAITEVEFKLHENFEDPQDITQERNLPIKLRHLVDVSKSEQRAVVSLDCHIGDVESADVCPFYVHVKIMGKFYYADTNGSPADFDKKCKINATAILYPYLRSAVTDITKIANIQPLVMPIVNVNKLLGTEKHTC